MAKSTESLTVEVYRNSTSQKIASFKTTTNWARYSVTYAYVRRIKRGTITIDDVPETIRDEVRTALEKSK